MNARAHTRALPLLAAGLALAAACEPAPAAHRARSPSTARPAASPAAAAAPAPNSPRATEGSGGGDATGADGTAAGIAYLERELGGASANERLPMVVAIHGLGDEPRAFVQLFAGLGVRARLIAPRGTQGYYGGYSWFPVRLDNRDPEHVEPGLSRAADGLAAALRELVRARPTCGAPVVTGFSQGGMLSYALAARHADLLGAALPISGMLPPSEFPAPGAGATRWPAVRALHGEADGLVPVGAARDTVAALLRAGAPAELRTYPGVGHTVSLAMRRDLGEWLRAAVAAQGCGS